MKRKDIKGKSCYTYSYKYEIISYDKMIKTYFVIAKFVAYKDAARCVSCFRKCGENVFLHEKGKKMEIDNIGDNIGDN